VYNVSQAYQIAETKAVKQFKVRGKCCGIDYTAADILKGSLTVSQQASSPTEITLGAVYIGQLTATFLNMPIARNSWVGGTITLQVGLKLAGGLYEFVPVGTYTIAEAKHSRSGVEIVAYDNMSKFDRLLSFSTSYGTPYELLTAICASCVVELGMTEEEVEALPNGTRTLGIYAENDCETFRDLLSWIACTTCCFATIDRQGRLVLRPFYGTSVGTFDDTKRFTGCKFSDYITSYAGITVNDLDEGGTRTYTNGKAGVTLDIGDNPLMQYGVDVTLDAIGNAIAYALTDVEYVPFEATMLIGVEFDLGDVLTMTDGTAGTSSSCIVHSINWTFDRGCSLKGYGSNPDAGQAKSRYDKMISGMKGNKADEIKYYVFQNAGQYNISDGNRQEILYINFATVKGGYIIFQCEIHAEVDGEITFYYRLNGADLDFVPIETFTDVNNPHIINLFLPYKAEANTVYDLYLIAEMAGGDCFIDIGNLRAMVYGQGLAATDEWNGIIAIDEDISRVALDNLAIVAISDAMTFDADEPTGESFSQNIGLIQLNDISVIPFDATVAFNRDTADNYTWNGFGQECSDWDDANNRFVWG
jgi:hypothetical protein